MVQCYDYEESVVDDVNDAYKWSDLRFACSLGTIEMRRRGHKSSGKRDAVRD